MFWYPTQSGWYGYTISFYEVTEDDVWEESFRLDGTNASPVGDVLVGMFKPTIDIHNFILTKIINLSLRNSFFLDDLKAAEVSLIFFKKWRLDKENYRTVSVLSHISRVFQRNIHISIESFMEQKLFKLLTGFRKSHSTQHVLVNMLENWKNSLDQGSSVFVIFMNLPKFYDTMNYD